MENIESEILLDGLIETESKSVEVVEFIETQSTLLVLPQSEIKKFRYFDGASSSNIRYSTIDEIVVVCAEELLAVVTGKIAKYNQIAKLKKSFTPDAKSVKEDLFYSMDKMNDILFSYEIAKLTYQKDPEKYASYVRFVANGGMNHVAGILGIPANFAEPKDLDYLGVDMADFAIEKPKVIELPIQVPIQLPIHTQESHTLEAEKIKPEPLNVSAQQFESSEKRIDVLFSKIDKQSKLFESLLNAFEATKEGSDNTFKSIETAFNGLKEQQASSQTAIQSVLNDFNLKIETIEKQAVENKAANQKNTEDPLRKIFTNQKIWLRLAIVVTLIFLPFTVMGLYKHIAIPTDAWYSAFGVGLLCVAIALVWDMAIFLFTINGKKGMAIFGSMVQVVFFSAKFNLMAQIVSDFGYNGQYWQNLLVVFCAVIYSPMLLANVADLSINHKK